MEWITTTILLKRLQEFDDQAWERFNLRFRGPIVQFVIDAGLPSSEAEDVAQETLIAFAKNHRKGGYDRDRSSLRSWLFAIAHNKLIDSLRRRQRQRAGQESVGGQTSFWENLPAEEESLQSFEECWKKTVLQQCLHQIRREFRENTHRVFEMLAFEGRSAKEVTEELGISRNAVFIAKHRVLKRLQELLADVDAEAMAVQDTGVENST